MKPMVGVIHGNKIERKTSPGMPEGLEVEVSMRVIPSAEKPGDGLRCCAGILGEVWTEADDQILEEIQQARHLANFRDIPE